MCILKPELFFIKNVFFYKKFIKSLIVENSHILAGIYFIFLKNVH